MAVLESEVNANGRTVILLACLSNVGAQQIKKCQNGQVQWLLCAISIRGEKLAEVCYQLAPPSLLAGKV